MHEIDHVSHGRALPFGEPRILRVVRAFKVAIDALCCARFRRMRQAERSRSELYSNLDTAASTRLIWINRTAFMASVWRSPAAVHDRNGRRVQRLVGAALEGPSASMMPRNVGISET